MPGKQSILSIERYRPNIDQKPLLDARLAVETIVKLLGRLPEEAVSIAPDIQIFLAENA